MQLGNMEIKKNAEGGGGCEKGQTPSVVEIPRKAELERGALGE